MGEFFYYKSKIYFQKDGAAIGRKFILYKFSFLAFTFFVFLFSSYVSAQVIIKEKVEINPSAKTFLSSQQDLSQFTRGFTPCGPYMQNTEPDHYWQVVWAGYWGPIDPAQQLFETQGNVYFGNFVNTSDGPYDIKIIEGVEYCSFQECIPEDYGCRWTDMEYTDLTGVSGNDLKGSGDYMFFDCLPRHVDQTYHMRYHYFEQGEETATVVYRIYSYHLNKTKYFHTLIVKRPFILEENSEPTQIPHAEKQLFTPKPEPVFCSSLDTSSYYENYTCKGIGIFSAGGGFPDNITFNISIVDGEEYGTMLYYDSYNNETVGNSFSGIDEYTYESLYFYANGIEPEDTGKVKIHISTSDPTVPEADANIDIVPNQNYPIRVTFIPSELAPGDTADILLEKRYSNYPFSDPENVIYEPFSSIQLFNVKIGKGSEYGTILNTAPSDTSDEFNNIEQGLKFIAADSIDIDTAKISLRVSTIIDNGGIIAASMKSDGISNSQMTRSIKDLDRKKSASSVKRDLLEEDTKSGKSDKDITRSIIPNSIVPPTQGGEFIFGMGHTKIVKDVVEIMLGETKYYGVKKKTETGELKIEEIKTDYGDEPKFPADADGWDWIKSDVWPTEPVEKIEGNKVAVYWEKEKPVWNGSTKKENTPLGIIRLIGQYWEEGETYKVKLKAMVQNEGETFIEIEVKKPKKLHNSKSGLKKEMTKYKDIDGSEKNIDEICIKNAGVYGIPPQFLKGQMFGEAGKNTKTGTFFPSYRYEPYTTQWDKYLKSWSGKFYFKDKTSADFSDVPNHQNVQYMEYWTTAKTVWEIIEENSQLNSISNPKYYGKRNSDNTMDFDRDHFPWLQDKYDEILKIEQARKDIKKAEQMIDSANYKMAQWFKEKWKGGKAYTEVAQTRCASSYGLLQMMYTTARDEKSYPLSEVPEKLNELSLFSHWVEYQSDLLGSFLNTNNWTDGFESSFETLVVKKWNPATSYPSTYFSNSKLFIPQ